MAGFNCHKLYSIYCLMAIIISIGLCYKHETKRLSDRVSGNRAGKGSHPGRRHIREEGGSDRHFAGDVNDANRNPPVSEKYVHGWKAGGGNCSCPNELAALRRDMLAEAEERKTLKKALDNYVTDLMDVKDRFNSSRPHSLAAQAKKTTVSFSAKLSYNRELKPLDAIVFDSVLSNDGQAYDPDTGMFTTPLSGVYMFHSTVLSGYNTKVETAIVVNGKEMARIYSGAHDAHGSGSNMAVLDLNSDDVVWVRLLYQGGNHIHGYYSTFSGVLLNEMDV